MKSFSRILLGFLCFSMAAINIFDFLTGYGGNIFPIIIGLGLLYVVVFRWDWFVEKITPKNQNQKDPVQQQTPVFPNEQTKQSPASMPAAHSVSREDRPKEDDGILVPEFLRGHVRKYHYENVKIFSPAELVQDIVFDESLCGQILTLKKEQENPYDQNAVAVYTKERKIGYLYRGKLQDMANDFLADDLPIWSAITTITPETKEIYIFLAFYRGKPSFDYEDLEVEYEDEYEDDEEAIK